MLLGRRFGTTRSKVTRPAWATGEGAFVAGSIPAEARNTSQGERAGWLSVDPPTAEVG